MQNLIANFESLSKEDLTRYAGEWIAVINSKIVAHGKNFKQVYQESKRLFPNERPLIGKLPEALPLVLSIC